MTSEAPAAIVTGGAQGLGAGICIVLLKKGYRVCVADVQEKQGKDFVQVHQKAYGENNVIFSHCDVTKESDYDDAFHLAQTNFGRVDFLMLNAGISREQEPKKVIEVNLIGVINGFHAALRHMGKRSGGKGGIVISTGSIASYCPIARAPAYTASKHGVVGFTKAYGRPYHFEKDGVMFAAICPNFVDTPMLRTGQRNVIDPDPGAAPIDGPIELEGLMSPEYVAGGVMKILEDRINGSVLLVTADKGYQYVPLHPDFERFIDTFG